MQIGIPAEVRPGETRVAATPETVKKLAAGGHHTVVVQSGAGVAASVPDQQYVDAGATIVASAAELYQQVGHRAEGASAAARRGCRRSSAARSSPACSTPTMPPASTAVRGRASPGLRWSGCRASRARRPWTFCPPRPTSPATRP